MHCRAQPLVAATMQQQSVGGDQQNLEEDEQVEQVTGQEGTTDSGNLELEQCMKVAAAAVITTAGIKVDQQGQYRGDQYHQRTEPVQHQHDAEWCLPVPQTVDLDLVLPR